MNTPQSEEEEKKKKNSLNTKKPANQMTACIKDIIYSCHDDIVILHVREFQSVYVWVYRDTERRICGPWTYLSW